MKRVLIKLSGEGLSNKEKRLDVDPKIVKKLVFQIQELLKRKIEVGIVVGGGNFWRGVSAEKNGIERNNADYIGMLATIMNGLALQSSLEKESIVTKIQSSLNIDPKIAETYVSKNAIKYLEKGQVVIFVGGIGRPYFTTDTISVLVATEIKADYILMGKNGVDGIYDSDPNSNNNAKKIEKITWDEILQKKLTVMDSTAASFARDNKINLCVFDIKVENAILKLIDGNLPHTKVVK